MPRFLHVSPSQSRPECIGQEERLLVMLKLGVESLARFSVYLSPEGCAVTDGPSGPGTNTLFICVKLCQ
jgi:hypothetical protein